MKLLTFFLSLIIILSIACNGEDKDNTAPEIELLGYNPSYVQLDSAFIEPGFIATDDIDGDITNQVETSGTVNTNIEGSYYLKYNVSDKAGNNAPEKQREVIVAVF